MYLNDNSPGRSDPFDPIGVGAGVEVFPRRIVATSGDPTIPVVAIIDDDEGARKSTAWLLEGEGYRTMSFASGDAFLEARLPERLCCALLDLSMPGRGGLEVLRELKFRDVGLPVVVLSGQADLATAVAAMKLDAIDVIQKPYLPDTLLLALEGALALRSHWRTARAVDREARAKIDGLPGRLREVLIGVVRGKANKVIAWEMGLSVRTVEAYRARLFQNLRVRKTAEAVRIAVAAGLE
jgi:two-component system response regulator FixJ